jgi:hypothetical protein
VRAAVIGLEPDQGGAVTPEELEAEFVRLAGEGELDKIQRILRSRRDQVPRDVVAEIVQDACLEVVRRQQAGGRITNLAGLIMTIASRALEKTWVAMADGFEVDVLPTRTWPQASWNRRAAWRSKR